ncbi:hypothetical protein LSUE1_G007150 [Lachnellula suecica]|uniref:Carboxylic ester hydrolase n=1 Tax=Lachnellula suecica TaxID=602035 RepID=A0A8T9C3U6_9HELO|nr:hypothetical protein LSUE1_G007150 [Lachnellula suecica]
MASRYATCATLLIAVVFGETNFGTVTKIQTLVVRDANTISASINSTTCDPSPSGGLPPICLTDLGSFDPALFEYSTNISTTPDTSTFQPTTESITTNTVFPSMAKSCSAGSIDNCPWTTIPSEAQTTAITSRTSNPQYQFTYTDASKKVIECQTFSTDNFGGVIASVSTMQMGSSKVNVGTSMTGDVLFKSISTALGSLCPTPTSVGAWTSCETGTITVGEAAWLDKSEPEKGDLTIHVTDAQYNSSDYLNLFVNMIAGAANASATGSNCDLLDWSYVTNKRDVHGRAIGGLPTIIHKGKDTFCNMNSFLDTQWYNGAHEAATMWFETEFGFEAGQLGNFDCESTVGIVGDVLAAIFAAIAPEFEWLVELGVQVGELACEAEETFNKPSKRGLGIDQFQSDAKLNKAWEKEMKKDRRLPMPEHKKRELGLLD